MNNTTDLESLRCQKVLQLSKRVSFVALFIGIVALSICSMTQGYESLVKDGESRGPASVVEGPELVVTYEKDNIFSSDYLMKNDNNGILKRANKRVLDWQDKEYFLQNWDLDPIVVGGTINNDEKFNYISKSFLKYLDKNIVSYLKKRKGSNADLISNSIVSSSSNVNFAPGSDMKFRAKVLQGRASFYLMNPFFNFDTNYSITGTFDLNLYRHFDSVGLKTNIKYDVNGGRWVASIDKGLTEAISAKISAEQDIDSEDSFVNQKGELLFKTNF